MNTLRAFIDRFQNIIQPDMTGMPDGSGITRSSSLLPGCPSAVNQYRVPRNERRGRRREKDNGPGNLHRLTNAMERSDSFNDIRAELRSRKHFLRTRCADERGRYSVDRDVVLAPLDSQALRQMRDTGFRHAID
jgi:hypothetical protein